MSLLYDTNILIEAVRFSQNDQKKFLKLINPRNEKVYISIATLAEVHSFSIQAGWGAKRNQELDILLENIVAIDIFNDLVDAYVEIDIFAQGKHPTIPLPTITKKDNNYKFKGNALNMGKNDIWIAATAKVFDCSLVTTDDDFDYLNGVFIEVIKIEKDDKGLIIL